MVKNVIILGMARSGTSLVTSIFGNAGYYIGEDNEIAETNHMNPTGFWESLSLSNINGSILRASGFAHDNTWIYDAISDDQVDFINKYSLPDTGKNLLTQFEKHQPWAWKDPRLCYTLGCWWPHLDSDNTVVILVKRNRNAIFNSFVRVGWRKNTADEKQLTYQRIADHIANAESLLKQHSIPALVIDYNDFKIGPRFLRDKINRFANLDLSLADLHYEEKYNHDNFKGKIGTLLDRFVSRLPTRWLKGLKRLAPKALLKVLYPERFK
jgi:hypothetical protein